MARERSEASSKASTARSNGSTSLISGFTSTRPSAHEIDREVELLIESERAAQLDFLRDNDVDGKCHIAAEAELNDDPAGSHRVERSAQRGLVARRLEQHIERPLVLSVECQRLRLVGDVDRARCANLCGQREGIGADIRRDDFRRAAVSRRQDRKRTDGSAACNKHFRSEK